MQYPECSKRAINLRSWCNVTIFLVCAKMSQISNAEVQNPPNLPQQPSVLPSYKYLQQKQQQHQHTMCRILIQTILTSRLMAADRNIRLLTQAQMTEIGYLYCFYCYCLLQLLFCASPIVLEGKYNLLRSIMDKTVYFFLFENEKSYQQQNQQISQNGHFILFPSLLPWHDKD